MSLFAELKRRNVFRVAIAYVVVAWLVLQVADVMIDNIGAPEWLFKFIVLLLGIGFPVAMVFAWAFEMTPEGIKRESEVDRSQSITRHTGRKLDFIIIGVLAVALGYFVWESRFANPGSGYLGSESNLPESAAQGQAAAGDLTLTPNTAAAQDRSIAVLPFANRSAEEADLFFTDGIHDDLLTQLAKIQGLKVISRTSVMQYRNTTKPIPEIARELGVGRVLEGAVQRAGKRIRINAQLIDVATDEHLWAETFDREMTVENIFDIQSEITRQIVQAIRGELSPEEKAAISELPTHSLEAYEAFLKARNELSRPEYAMDKYIAADGWLEKALEFDPEFAQAWALRVATHCQYIWQGEDDSPARAAMAREALAKAEQFGPGEPDTLAARAEILYRIDTDFGAAEALYEAALDAKPGDSQLLASLAYTERRTGHFEQSLTHLQAGIELDPANRYARTIMLETLVGMGAWDRAEPLADLWMTQFPNVPSFQTAKASILAAGRGDLAAARELLDRTEPFNGPAYLGTLFNVLSWQRDFEGLIESASQPPISGYLEDPLERLYYAPFLAQAYRAVGQEALAQQWLAEAIAFGESYGSESVNGRAFGLLGLGLAQAEAGQLEEALANIEQAVALKPESRDSYEGSYIAAGRALVLGRAGQRDESLAEVQRLLETAGSNLSRWQLHFDPAWDFFRDDPRFVELATPPDAEAGGVP